ncbi:MAG: DUF4230 domain-containing protein [Kiritimatiellia bacterium]|jgi:hypothetical protein
MNTLIALIAGFVIALLALSGLRLLRGRRKGAGGRQTAVASSIEKLKAIGELSVFKALTKEIVTEVDHTWGEFGRKYLSWILSNKKMAMIFAFEIDFRYDLRSPEFQVEVNGTECVFKMPPCKHEINIRDIQFYDEQKSRLVPWLLPDLLNTLFTDGFTEQDRNRLKDAARNSAKRQAALLIGQLGSEVEHSAQQTLSSLAKAFGLTQITFVFPRQDTTADLPVKYNPPPAQMSV